MNKPNPGLGKAAVGDLLDSLLVAKDVAATILKGFNKHFRIYLEITREARQHFIDGDWPAGRRCVSERISLYDTRVQEAIGEIKKLMLARLGGAGHSVTLANDGVEALAKAREQVFDLVLMDVRMPEMDGIQATAEIRKLPPPHGTVPIIAVTAHAMRGDRERYIEAGMDDYVSKPVDFTALFQVVHKVLERHRKG